MGPANESYWACCGVSLATALADHTHAVGAGPRTLAFVGYTLSGKCGSHKHGQEMDTSRPSVERTKRSGFGRAPWLKRASMAPSKAAFSAAVGSRRVTAFAAVGALSCAAVRGARRDATKRPRRRLPSVLASVAAIAGATSCRVAPVLQLCAACAAGHVAWQPRYDKLHGTRLVAEGARRSPPESKPHRTQVRAWYDSADYCGTAPVQVYEV